MAAAKAVTNRASGEKADFHTVDHDEPPQRRCVLGYSMFLPCQEKAFHAIEKSTRSGLAISVRDSRLFVSFFLSDVHGHGQGEGAGIAQDAVAVGTSAASSCVVEDIEYRGRKVTGTASIFVR